MNINRLDLNLLKIFDAIYRTRSVSRAADEVALSQPAVSNALNRLRGHLDDELFIRDPRGMTPTARATQIAPKISEALNLVGSTLRAAGDFDPATLSRRFRIGASDYETTLLLPPMIEHVLRAAPGIQLLTQHLATCDVRSALDEGSLDLTFGLQDDMPARHACTHLWREEFAVLLRRGHELAKPNMLSLATYCEARHALLSMNGDDRGIVDRLLAAQGMTRRVYTSAPYFAALGAMVASSDLIATIPSPNGPSARIAA